MKYLEKLCIQNNMEKYLKYIVKGKKEFTTQKYKIILILLNLNICADTMT